MAISGDKVEPMAVGVLAEPMTVGTLRAILADLPDNMLVEVHVHYFDADEDSGVEIEAPLCQAWNSGDGPLVLFGDMDEAK